MCVGEELCVFFLVEERSEGMMVEDIFLCIIYEDDVVFIINKEVNMLMILFREYLVGSVVNVLLFYYDK